MATCGVFLRTQFPTIDDQIYEYIHGVLENGAEEFKSSEDVYDAIGDMLKEVSGTQKTEDEILTLCDKLLCLMKSDTKTENEPAKVLSAPVHLGSMAANLEANVDDFKSIWVVQRDDSLKVDPKKLEKAEAKLQQKQGKRLDEKKTSVAPKVNTASASQVISKKDTKTEVKGTNNNKNIRIENFDVAFGERVLLRGADILLAYGKRYGLVGRNGLGKTTLLRMISGGQLKIPSHISILHVEQEVVGDDTVALQSVLESDTVRENLLKEERELTAQMNTGNAPPEVSARLADVYADLQNIEADKAPARASIILAGLGFNPYMQKQTTKEFSGGWRMRLALARALFSKPDLLLLDEPTNMLDMKAIIWLENYLQGWQSTLLVVSHDQNFLNTVPTDILHLHTQRIDAYKGNYENFIKTRTERLKNQQREYESQKMYREHVQEFIDKFRYNAKRASLVQSKIKMLEKLPELKPVVEETVVQLRFPLTEALSPPILQLDEVSFSYIAGKPVLTRVNLSATLESRICIVGENGAGKSTLLKILMEDLTPSSGIRHAHRNLKFGYFSQHHVDQLNMDVCPVEFLQSKFPGKPVEEYRRMLGGFGISGDLALQSINSLSGGQKSRVAFAVMSVARPNFLILDEPTNHLDIETIEALGNAINDFNGGVILVSHDERLICMVCKELWVCGEGNVHAIEGGFDEYRRIVERELEAQAK